IKQRIHDHMVKMPFCRKYFAMLGVINFLSYYLMTLKKHGKLPVLPEFTPQAAQCPSLFPPLPILNAREEDLKINLRSIVKNLTNNTYQQLGLKWYLLNKMDQQKTLMSGIKGFCWDELKKNMSEPLKR